MFSSFTSLQIQPGARVDMALAAEKYGNVFYEMVWLGLASAALALLLRPLLRRWMHGVR